MASVRHHEKTPTGVPSDRYHRGVMPAAKFFSNCLIEIPHEWDLFQGAKVQVHKFPELLAYCRHSVSVAAHMRERDTSDDAARADGHLVNIPATLPLPGRA
jgi:hypothetical protein